MMMMMTGAGGRGRVRGLTDDVRCVSGDDDDDDDRVGGRQRVGDRTGRVTGVSDDDVGWVVAVSDDKARVRVSGRASGTR